MLGPPGSGKGTQAERISEYLKLYKISIGDMFREAINKNDEIGENAKRFLAKGKLVPDEIVFEMVKRELKNAKGKDIVFDGLPRTIKQAIALDRLLGSIGKKVNGVLYLDVPLTLLLKRLSQRCICPKCGTVYNLKTNPPKIHNRCDKCSSMLQRREDDREEIVRSRFEIYEKETAPVKEYYNRRGLLMKIDSSGNKDEVWRDVKEKIVKKICKEVEIKKGVNEK
ncbi:adenylate kinase [candidate division WOR-3 bacterium]|nr:adenylate kinase [candidate division WOR-3 bacterium]MCK4575234.1 adenylate kinase [candidate division WOR-3 bacterium]